MKRLIGTFHVQLSAPLLLKGSGETRCIKSLVDGFDVELRIAPDLGMRSQAKRERLWSEGCLTLELSVARDEAEGPPEPFITPRGGRDWSTQTPYFDERAPQYSRAACKAVNNAISFFKYELHQPLLTPVPENSNFFANPEWSDEEGNEIGGGRSGLVSPGIPGWRGDLMVERLERKHVSKLARAMGAPRAILLHEQILSDAQAAAFEGNIRRAVIELAVACEVFVKDAFLGRDDRAARVYEALEDKARINVRVLDLIDVGGLAAIGTSFRSHDSEAFRDIDYLFRARNRAAHRGKLTYRDDSGVSHEVTFKVLAAWWVSAGHLMAWVREHGMSPQAR